MNRSDYIIQKARELFNLHGYNTMHQPEKLLADHQLVYKHDFADTTALLKRMIEEWEKDLALVMASFHDTENILERLLKSPSSSCWVVFKYRFIYRDFQQLLNGYGEGITKILEGYKSQRINALNSLIHELYQSKLLSDSIYYHQKEFILHAACQLQSAYFAQTTSIDSDFLESKLNYLNFLSRFWVPYLTTFGQLDLMRIQAEMESEVRILQMP